MLAYVKKFDWVLFGSAVILTVFGLAAIYSTSLGAQGAGGDFGNFWKQASFVVAGLLVALAAAAFNYRQLAGLSRFLYALALGLLVAVLVFGQTVRGARSWFGFGGLGVQPVEVVKI